MMKNNENFWVVEIPQLILCLFIILQFIAMMTYSGGTFFDHQNAGYSFTRNFLSDLGRTVSFSGHINFIASLLFNMSLLLSGCVFVIFYYKIHNIFVEYNYMGLAFWGSVFGIVGGISMAVVGLSPSDLYLPIHDVSARWLFRCFFAASICYSVIIYRSYFIENKYAAGYLLFSLSILTYIFISELGPSPLESELALTIQVVSQKIILVVFISAIFFQTLGFKKLRL